MPSKSSCGILCRASISTWIDPWPASFHINCPRVMCPYQTIISESVSNFKKKIIYVMLVAIFFSLESEQHLTDGTLPSFKGLLI